MSINRPLFPRALNDVASYLLRDEELARTDLLAEVAARPYNKDVAFAHSLSLISNIRESSKGSIGVESMLREYSLSAAEGVLLMCLAESLLRVPDALTVNRLIPDKITSGDCGA